MCYCFRFNARVEVTDERHPTAEGIDGGDTDCSATNESR
jgi:hypothetical protein